jgi:uncharacterized iron-regulated membrane protein
MAINWRIKMRHWHRLGAILIALPFLLVILTGILLQLKKEVSWIQPPTMKGGKNVSITLDNILQAARQASECEVKEWKDIARIDMQPGKGIAKVQARNNWELQIDLQSGAVLQVAYRRSDLIESLHDGSWFHDNAKLYIFLPSGIIVLGLWFTGIYLFFLPYSVRWARRRREQAT